MGKYLFSLALDHKMSLQIDIKLQHVHCNIANSTLSFKLSIFSAFWLFPVFFGLIGQFWWFGPKKSWRSMTF